MTQPKEWKFQALTDIWTGDAQGKPERLIPTGIMGSLRWWFEVLVRGLGGEACDPTVKGVRCPQDTKKKPTDPGHHCVVCELFGCTGWARKFRLMILDEQGQVIQNQIEADQTFTLRFIPLRHISDEEWCLLDATLRLIACYGAIGGKTVFKPSEEWGIADLGADDLEEHNGQVVVRRSRKGLPLQKDDVILEVEGSTVSTIADLESLVREKQHGDPIKVKIQRNGQEQTITTWAGKRHHQDFGLVLLHTSPPDLPPCIREQAEHYVQDKHWRKNIPLQYQENEREYDYSWASLENFWCVKGRYLARRDYDTSSYNFVIGRPEPKNQASQGDSWLAGRQQESKKVFSFKEPSEARRTFGFVQSEDFSSILDKLQKLRDGNGNERNPDPVWQDFDPDSDFLKGKEDILDQLFQQEETV